MWLNTRGVAGDRVLAVVVLMHASLESRLTGGALSLESTG